MNSEQLQANWQKIKGHAKEKWGELTDDDLIEVEGSADRLMSKLINAYGYSKEKAEKELKNFLNGYDDSGEKINTMIDNAADVMSDAAGKVADIASNCQEFAKKKPLATLGLLFATGLAMGLLIAR